MTQKRGGPNVGEKQIFRTTDLALSAFLKLRGLPLVGTEIDDAGRTVFLFDNATETAGLLRVEFANSECYQFDAEKRGLKKLIFGR